MALTRCKVYTLDRSIVFKNQNNIKGLTKAISFGNEVIKEYGIPIQDYRIMPCNQKKVIGMIAEKKRKRFEKVK